jgi:hypothetical protein
MFKMPLKIKKKIKNHWILLKTDMNIKENMGDNLIDVFSVYISKVKVTAAIFVSF